MGLDMYLRGKTGDMNEELGYWRKHPNLHGFIVEQFANGIDECQSIPLTVDNMEDIIAAAKDDKLPHTTGFFFGQSYGDEGPEDVRIFESAIAWLEQNPTGEVFYRASW